jgi:hypothetical protein
MKIRSTALDLPYTGNQKEANMGNLTDAFSRFSFRTYAKEAV